MNGWPPFKRFSLRLTFSASAASTQAAKDCGALLPLWVNSVSQARRAVATKLVLTLTPRTFLAGFFCRPWSGLLAMLALLALLSLLASLALLAMLAILSLLGSVGSGCLAFRRTFVLLAFTGFGFTAVSLAVHGQ